jgi:hypothetical protein
VLGLESEVIGASNTSDRSAIAGMVNSGDGDEVEAGLRHDPGPLRADEAPGDERRGPGPPRGAHPSAAQVAGGDRHLGRAPARQSRAIRSVSSAKNAASSTSRTKCTFLARPLTPHQSTAVWPMVSSDPVSISTFTSRPR